MVVKQRPREEIRKRVAKPKDHCEGDLGSKSSPCHVYSLPDLKRLPGEAELLVPLRQLRR